MGGNNRERKSSCFMSVFSIFKSNNKHRGGGYDDAYEESSWARKVLPSDEDRGRWGADPGIDTKADNFITKYKKRVSESEIYGPPQDQRDFNTKYKKKVSHPEIYGPPQDQR